MSTGISEEKINMLCGTLEDYREKIYQVLLDIEGVTETMQTYYKGDTSTEVFSKLNLLNQNRFNINDNILSYIDDLRKIRDAYKSQDINISEEINMVRNSVLSEK